MKDLFINTFAVNLPKDRRAERATDADWRNVFDGLEKNLVVCPRCSKVTFREPGKCFECAHLLADPVIDHRTTAQARHKVVFKVLSAGEVKKELEAYVSDEISGAQVSKHLPPGMLFKIMYNKSIQKLGIKNLSASPWTIVCADKSKKNARQGRFKYWRRG